MLHIHIFVSPAGPEKRAVLVKRIDSLDTLPDTWAGICSDLYEWGIDTFTVVVSNHTGPTAVFTDLTDELVVDGMGDAVIEAVHTAARHPKEDLL